MRQSVWVLAILMMAGASASCLGAPTPSSKDVVERAMRAFNQGKLDGFVKALHPDALERLRAQVLEVLDDATKAGKEAPFLKTFAGVTTPEDLKELDGGQMILKMLEAATASPDVKQAMAGTRIEVLGRFVEQDRTYVVYQSKVKLGELSMDRLNVAVLRKSGEDLKLDIPEDLLGNLGAMRRAFQTGDTDSFPDLKQTQVEPLGHVLEGKTAFVVYRTLVPIGNSTLSRLAVLSVKSDSPGWDAVRKNKKDEVKSLIEKRLGLVQEAPRRLSPAAQKRADRLRAAMEKEVAKDLAAMKARRQEFQTAQQKEMKARMEASRERMDAMQKAFRERTASNSGNKNQAGPSSAGQSNLPNGLVAIPPSFLGANFNPFQDLAPADGVLIGVRVSFDSKPSGPTISSIQPVYRVGDNSVDGQRHGSLLGKETEVLAKPGYAVGAIKMRAAVTLHGFGLVYMKIDGDHLDPSQSYSSEWLGNERTGLNRNVSTNGKIPVGVQGKADDAVNALGLIVKE